MQLNWRHTILYRFFQPDFFFDPIHAATLGLLRIVFGSIMLIQALRIEDYFITKLANSEYYLHYDFFEWLPHLTPGQMTTLFLAMKILSVMIAIGLFTRWVSGIFFVLFTYILLVDKGHFNNHYYLISLFSLV
ncbi:MAG: HTTM domain-containing protein, partial [Bacteroidota bacterium]